MENIRFWLAKKLIGKKLPSYLLRDDWEGCLTRKGYSPRWYVKIPNGIRHGMTIGGIWGLDGTPEWTFGIDSPPRHTSIGG